MAITVTNIISRRLAETAATIQYTATGVISRVRLGLVLRWVRARPLLTLRTCHCN
jgi:hypothetical protein